MSLKRTSSEALEASKEADLQEAADEKAYAKEAGNDADSSSEESDLEGEDGEGTPVKFADDDLKYRPGEPICYIFTTRIDKGEEQDNDFTRIPMRCLTEETLQQLKEWNQLEVNYFDYDNKYDNKPVKRPKDSEESFAKRLKAYEVNRRVAKLFFIIKFLENRCETITCYDFVGHHDVKLVLNVESVRH